MKKTLRLTFLLSGFFWLNACTDEEPTSAINTGAEVSISNTLEIAAAPEAGGTGGTELPIEVILGVPENTYTLSASVGTSVEFANYLEGLYDVDISASSISFDLVAASDHPIYQPFFRTIEPGTYDRYYLTFPEGHSVNGYTVDNEAVTLEILSNTELVITIGEGWNFRPGSSFLIQLN